ncbi:alpha/beta hydrolase [Rhodococcus maanshanensis]|nr:alpha/beta hydrolase [Rhodococcus maanshanensis]MCZ4558660.1 alpha/beta hydrolase [Rhodococcus maanshanensis]
MSPAAEPDFVPGASLRSQVLAMTLRMTVKPFLGVWAVAPGLSWPAGILDRVARVLPSTQGASHSRVELPRCAAELVVPAESSSGAAIVYLHGGAFVTCGMNTHRRLTGKVAAAAGAVLLNVDYRMMPRHSIADAVEDGVAGYRWLRDRGFGANQIVLAGDSAGGYLVFAVALRLAELGLQPPAGLVAISPLTDMDSTVKVAHPAAGGCPVFPRAALPALTRLADQVDRRTDRRRRPPRVSPVDAPLAGLPPVLIHVGSTEILFPDAELMARRLTAAGVPVTLRVWDRQVHVFHAAADLIPEGTRAIAEIGEFIRCALSGADRSGPDLREHVEVVAQSGIGVANGLGDEGAEEVAERPAGESAG